MEGSVGAAWGGRSALIGVNEGETLDSPPFSESCPNQDEGFPMALDAFLSPRVEIAELSKNFRDITPS
jgi:hypothetical protein